MSQRDKSSDLRIRRTRLALRGALLALIEEKGFEEIIVQDIADRAMINRVTFYKHYRDKYELLEQTMREMLGELAAGVEVLLHAPADKAVQEGLIDWFEQVGRHASFYRTMLGRAGNPAFAAQLRAHLEAMVAQAVEQLPPDERRQLPPEVVIRFAAAGFLGVTEWWLDQRRPIPPEAAAAHLHQLLLRVTNLERE
ncbi:MAG TPA: TetR/AcrR family transcriptional regulator [Herpetosiphonaceae bacterium]|nr:TetR/AcrR family transcriptional regulator [Herpetosiphonaceae bacterium]